VAANGRADAFSRGLDTLSLLVLALEIGDFARFDHPAKLAAWLGLMPALDQSGDKRRQSAITKTGSSYARRPTTRGSARSSRFKRGAVIGRNCKIQSQSFVCDGVEIDDEVFIEHGTLFINDKVPRATNRVRCRRAKIGLSFELPLHAERPSASVQ